MEYLSMNNTLAAKRNSVVLESISKLSSIDSNLIFGSMSANIFIKVLKEKGLVEKINHLPENVKKSLFADVEDISLIRSNEGGEFLEKLMDDANWYKTIYCPNLNSIDANLSKSLKNLERSDTGTLYDLLSLLYEINDLSSFMHFIFLDDFKDWLKDCDF